MIKQKKGSVLIWILIIMAVLIIGGFVAWIMLSGGNSIIPTGGSIPQPPALPSG